MSKELKRLRQRLLAWGLANLATSYERAVADYKRRLLSDLSGTVVEIGPGTGANLPYYPRGIRWIGIEPNPFMDRYLKRQAKALDIEIQIRRGRGEQLPIPDASADAVVSTLVLCSVSNLPGVLSEVLRVLRPGGRFVFIEHVAAQEGTRLRRLQAWLKPIWMRLGEGCQPDRETWIALERTGFAKLDYSRFKAPVPVVSPQIMGVGVK
ncbi:MAG TPA: class I SAM-dependent methyltransferase [Terriglobales bacterium]|nr:class I SAM-dependent methyltransferase [Terriglobales bacterium]